MARKITTATKPAIPNLMQRHRPWEEKCDFEIEKNEENGHEVVAHVKLHARVLEGFKATFVGGVLRGIRAVGAQYVAEDKGDNADGDADQDEQKDGEVLIEVHLEDVLTAVALPDTTLGGLCGEAFVLVPSARLELAQLSPLPPQDSVSTNFTTTAVFCIWMA
jgi:hypothetical protein